MTRPRPHTRSGRHGRTLRTITFLIPLALVAFGCNLVVGSYEFRDDTRGTDGNDDGGNADRPDADASVSTDADRCNVDLSNECYPCDPTTNDELLNACTEGSCIPFDRSRLTSLLLPDGALPPLPDGGTP